MKLKHFIPAVAVAFAACGGGEPADTDSGNARTPAPTREAATRAAPSGPMTTPEWYSVDHGARTVSLAITAGATSENNYWNYNGFTNGDLAITVPEGYTVSITLTNDDPNMAHSLGISAETSNFTMPPAAEPAFAGAITGNPTSMIDATMPGQTETIEFVADRAGSYSMVCFIPGHSAIGMWTYFNVVAGEEAGVQTR